MLNKESWLMTTPIAHRGLHNENFPENSIGAFANAKRHGYAIELDVQLSADNHIIVFHDFDTFRMTGEKGEIGKLNLSQIKSRYLLDSNFKIPTLNEVFNEIDSEIPILIEIKNHGKVGNLEKLLCFAVNQYQGPCAVESFNPFTLKIIKENCPNILRGQLSQKFKSEKLNIIKKIVLKNLWLNKVSSPHFISYGIDDLPNKNVAYLRDKGTGVIGWTITDEASYIKAKKYCDNIIFENISLDHESAGE